MLTTYRSEWGDASTGLPTRQTKVCAKVAPNVCTSASDYVVVPACVGTKIERASVPAGSSACLASEGWRVVSSGDAQYCDANTAPTEPSGAPAGWVPRCVQVSSIVIFGRRGETEASRLGITATRKLGPAVDRNRLVKEPACFANAILRAQQKAFQRERLRVARPQRQAFLQRLQRALRVPVTEFKLRNPGPAKCKSRRFLYRHPGCFQCRGQG